MLNKLSGATLAPPETISSDNKEDDDTPGNFQNFLKTSKHTYNHSFATFKTTGSDMTSLIIDSSSDQEDNNQDDEREFLENFLCFRRKRKSSKKRTNALVKEAQQIIQELQHHGGVKEGGGVKRKKLGKKLSGGAIGMEDTSNPNAPPTKKRKAGNPLKKKCQILKVSIVQIKLGHSRLNHKKSKCCPQKT